MKIEVRLEGSEAIMNEDGVFICTHDHTTIEPPCCSGIDCACNGLESTHCEDCGAEIVQPY